MRRILLGFLMCVLALATAQPATSRERELHIVTTGDVHGSWFDRPYVPGGNLKTSLMSVSRYVDSLRNAVGEDNVLLLDAGDCLQGDNAAYYYNYVDTVGEHLFSRIASYMRYDAIVVGNHDIETGHKVYDKVEAELAGHGIPFLGTNALRTDNGEPYFPMYKVFSKAGLKVAVLGFTNPNMKAWLSESAWKGMDFVSLLPFVQQCVDEVKSFANPDIIVVAVHSGTGDGDGSILESQGLDLLDSLHGVDLILCGHDHRQSVSHKGDCWLVDSGSRAGYVGHAIVSADKRRFKLASKSIEAEVVRMDKRKVDERMEEHFVEDFDKVKAFTMQRVGTLAMTMRTRDAYTGMCDYLNLIHTVQLGVPQARISFAAPLTFDGTVKAGELIYNDMFTIYPYENQLFVVKLKGSEIKSYLEYSYDNWIQTSAEHILKIEEKADPRTGAQRWSFVGRSYNFDSAAGLIYKVDVTKPFGSRITIESLADGSSFDPDGWYNVAMTSYRANGGGDIIIDGAGLSKDEIEGRIVARYPQIRDLVYEFISKHGTVTPQLVGDKGLIGEWRFVPEDVVDKLMPVDMRLIF